MNKHFLEWLSHASNIGFFKMINKKESIKSASKCLDALQMKWKKEKGHNRGGVVSSTYDVLHALLACIAPTMDDVRKNQPELFVESVKEGKFFAFVYRTTLADKINQARNHSAARLSRETIGNQIKRLIESGIILEKRNYSVRKDENGKQVNPLPLHLNPSGRGKIQLFINPEVLVFHSKYEDLKAYLRDSFKLYRVNSFYFNTKINKSTIDKPIDVNNQKDLPNGKGESSKIINKELGRKLSNKNKVSPRQFDSKRDFSTAQLLELCRSSFFDDRTFTDAIEKGAIQVLDDRINQAIEAVEAYRAEKIKTYTARDKYKNSTRKDWMLAQYTKNLPTPYRAAIEIMSFAIQKQAKHALNKGYLSKIKRHGNDPVQLISSSNFQYALNYSISDWSKINDNYFIRNQSYSTYCKIVGMIGKIYTYTVDLAYKSNSIAFAYTDSIESIRKLQKKINKNTSLKKSSKKALNSMIKTKFSPLFKSLTQEEKERLKSALNSKIA